jgi:ribosome biogenesis GTPase
MNLTAYGWTARLSALAEQSPELTPGRILSQEKGLYRLICADGELLAAVSGALRYRAVSPVDFPAVGDFVLLRAEAGRGVIQEVLPRTSVFVRKASGTAREEQVVAANVDTVFLCMALNNDFNLRRLERYLSIAWESGATPVVVLTKADLCEDLAERQAAVGAVAAGAEILCTSAMAEDGAAALLPYLAPGRAAAFLGSSGVGKSTLINRLLGGDVLKTNGLRNDDKGRHTTTHRELLLLPDGGIVIDTPGMRELGMWDAASGVDRAFSDVATLAAQCRFRDCTHTAEPGCAIQAAILAGELPAERWLSYQKLQGENAYAEDAEQYLASKEAKFKKIAKVNRTNKEH